MNYIKLDEFKNMPEYKNFIAENNSNGSLKIQAYTAHQGLPIPDTSIIVSKQIGNNIVEFYNGKTNEDGIIDDILLPAPNGTYNEETHEIPKPAIYSIIATNPLYESLEKF